MEMRLLKSKIADHRLRQRAKDKDELCVVSRVKRVRVRKPIPIPTTRHTTHYPSPSQIVTSAVICVLLSALISVSAFAFTAEDHYNRGIDKYLKEDFVGAIEELNAALKIDPQYKKAQQLLIIISAERERVKEEKIIKHFLKGKRYYKGSEYQKALLEFEKVLSLNPEHRGALEYRKKTQIKIAAPTKRELKTRKKRIEEFYQAGKVLYQEESYTEAVEKFKKVLDMSPGHSGAMRYVKLASKKEKEVLSRKKEVKREKEITLHYELGKIFYYEGKYQEAIDEFKKVISLDPERREATKFIATIHDELRRKEEEKARVQREEALKKAKAEKEKKIIVLLDSGRAFYKEEKYPEAIEEFKKVLDLDPERTEAIRYIREVRNTIGKREEARRRVQEMAQAKELEVKRHFTLGKSYYTEGRYEKAIREFEKALALNPKHTLATEHLAKIQEALKKREEGRLRTRREARAKEIEIERLLISGKGYCKRGKYQKAIKEFKKVLVINPEHSQAKRYIVATRGKIEKEKEAKLKAEREAKRRMNIGKIIGLYGEGRRLYQEGKLSEAKKSFKKILVLFPEEGRAIKYLAKIQRVEERAKLEELKLKERGVEEERSKEIARLFTMGKDYYKTDQYEKAIAGFKKVLEREPGHKGASQYLVRAEIKLAEVKREKKLPASKIERKIKSLQAKKYYIAGKDCYNRNDLSSALDQWDKALNVYPGYPEIGRYLIELKKKYLAGKLTPEVAQKFLRLLAEQRSNAEAKRLIQERKARQREEEEKERAVAINALFDRGKAYYRAEQYPEAIVEFEKVLALVSTHREAIRYLKEAREAEKGEKIAKEARARAEKLEAERRAKEAERMAKEKEREDRIVRHYKLAAEYYRENDLIAANEEFKKILGIDSEHKGAKKYLAKIEAKLEKAIREGGAYYIRGMAFYEQGQYVSAINQWEKVLELNPTHKGARANIKKAQEKLAQMRKAEKALARKRAVRSKESRIAGHYKKGYRLYKDGKMKAAIGEFEKVLKLDPKHKEAQEYLAKAHEQLTYPKRPLPREEVTPGRKSTVDTAEVTRHYNQGLIEYANGHIKRAIEEWELVLKLDPNHIKALKSLIRAKEELKRLQRQ